MCVDSLERKYEKEWPKIAEDLGALGVWAVEADTGEGWWSEGLFILHGLSPDLPPSWDLFLGRYPEEERARFKAALQAAFEGRSFDLKLQGHIGGDHIHVLVKGRPCGQKRVEKVVGSMQDITSQRRYEETLQAVLSTMPLPFALLGSDGRTLYGNRKYFKFFCGGHGDLSFEGGAPELFSRGGGL